MTELELADLRTHATAMTVMALNEYLTTEEVAGLCRARPETVRYWRHIGYGPPSFRVGRRVLYDATKVRSWLTERAAGDRTAA